MDPPYAIDLSDPACTILQAVHDDLLVCCASFEERSITALHRLHKTYSAESGIIYVNRENVERTCTTRLQLYKMIDAMARITGSVRVVEGSLFDASAQLDALRRALGTSEDNEPYSGTITVDATTFNRESLLLLCGLLATGSPRPSVRILYTSPKQHGQWLSRGVRKVRNVIGFGGARDPQLATALILLSGFEGERALKIIDEHEPAKLFVGIGDPPTVGEFLPRNLSEQHLLLSRKDVQRFTFPTNDLNRAYQSVATIARSCCDLFNVVIAPMSTKLSTLAVLRLAVEMPDIQITYCVPGEYNCDDYSTGVRTLYVDQLFPEKPGGI